MFGNVSFHQKNDEIHVSSQIYVTPIHLIIEEQDQNSKTTVHFAYYMYAMVKETKDTVHKYISPTSSGHKEVILEEVLN